MFPCIPVHPSIPAARSTTRTTCSARLQAHSARGLAAVCRTCRCRRSRCSTSAAGSAQTIGGALEASEHPDASQHPNSRSQPRTVSLVQQMADEEKRVAQLEARDMAEPSVPLSRSQQHDAAVAQQLPSSSGAAQHPISQHRQQLNTQVDATQLEAVARARLPAANSTEDAYVRKQLRGMRQPKHLSRRG